MLEVGNLYFCKEYHLMLYPDQETAAVAAAARRRSGGGGATPPSEPAVPQGWVRFDAAATAAYWSNRFGKPVFFLEKNIPILVLNNKEEYTEVLAEEKKGWIIYADWVNLKEIDYETIS